MMYSERLRDRFRLKVLEGGDDECWPWRGAKTRDGYGVMSGEHRGDNPLRAHRIAYELHFGPVPDGLHVLHHCDNPPCCNPNHLYAGTNAQNVSDKMARCRQSHTGLPGSRNPAANLNERAVLEIKRLLQNDNSRTMSAVIKARYDISAAVLSAIRRGKTWAHVTPTDGKETDG